LKQISAGQFPQVYIPANAVLGAGFVTPVTKRLPILGVDEQK
jgi:hypothetical protein